MTTETTISKIDAAELAHTFSWYMRDVAAGDNNGIYIYGDWLLSMQERMGVELMKPEYIRNSIARAKEVISAEAVA
jgi:hypothetical protein